MKDKTTDDFPTMFGKSLSFLQLYGFLKAHKQFLFNKDIPQSSCLCQISVSTVFLAKATNTAISTPICTAVHSLVETYSCTSPLKECMNSECDKCNGTGLTIGDFKNGQEPVKFYQWKKPENKVRKKRILLSCEEVCCYFIDEIRILEKHIFVKRQQHACYNSLKENLSLNEILLHVD